ncbi:MULTISPECIES: GNAT family N-acetyltransferase [unclassified Duganella]|uniref:GNAT family N-acetyltransferase n=1 Tax=unclassified Duganella TaxID=2636909 RepID=UPI0006F57CA9|nr:MULTISPECIES: GNAT family N-acetyltransferase [unclassified Duganella]KQV46705.1 GNAT family acetyltransferase [Duganella sp. Root336D2]KRC01003.1 GNAT family acetyltransferase [Duganella sp. Root198D2]
MNDREFELNTIDFALVERWLTGWSLSRGVPLPRPSDGGLVVEVGKPEQLRRHVFLDAGQALQACADRIRDPHIFLKAAVEPHVLRQALPARWNIEGPGYLMMGPALAPDAVAMPLGYQARFEAQHGAQVVRVIHESQELAASGRIVLHGRTAIFDQIETAESHRRRGLGSVVMQSLDSLAAQAGVTERLLVATEDGRALYTRLGWTVISPWSTAVLPAALCG